MSAAWNAAEPSMIIFGFLKTEIIPSSPDVDVELELSDGKENIFVLNSEVCELFQSDNKSSDFEGFNSA